jgi:hypothetical protein
MNYLYTIFIIIENLFLFINKMSSLYILILIKLIACQDDIIYYKLALDDALPIPSPYVKQLTVLTNRTNFPANTTIPDQTALVNFEITISDDTLESVPNVRITDSALHNEITLNITQDECISCNYMGWTVEKSSNTSRGICHLYSPEVTVRDHDNFDWLFEVTKYVGNDKGFALNGKRIYYVFFRDGNTYDDIKNWLGDKIDEEEYYQFLNIHLSNNATYLLTYTHKYIYIIDTRDYLNLAQKILISQLSASIPLLDTLDFYYDNSTLWIVFRNEKIPLCKIDLPSLNVHIIKTITDSSGKPFTLKTFSDAKISYSLNKFTLYTHTWGVGLHIIDLTKLTVTFYFNHCCLTDIIPGIDEKDPFIKSAVDDINSNDVLVDLVYDNGTYLLNKVFIGSGKYNVFYDSNYLYFNMGDYTGSYQNIIVVRRNFYNNVKERAYVLWDDSYDILVLYNSMIGAKSFKRGDAYRTISIDPNDEFKYICTIRDAGEYEVALGAFDKFGNEVVSSFHLQVKSYFGILVLLLFIVTIVLIICSIAYVVYKRCYKTSCNQIEGHGIREPLDSDNIQERPNTIENNIFQQSVIDYTVGNNPAPVHAQS